MVYSSKDLTELAWVGEVAKTILFLPFSNMKAYLSHVFPLCLSSADDSASLTLRVCAISLMGFAFFSQLSVIPGHYKSVNQFFSEISVPTNLPGIHLIE